MEGKRMKSESESENAILLTKIKDFTRNLIVNLTNGKSPIILINRFRNHCTLPHSNCFCGSDFPCGKEVLTLCKETHVHRLDVMLRVMLIVQKLLQEKKHSSKRDIYYMHPSVFFGHICAKRDAFTSYTSVGDDEDQVYLGDSRTAAVNGKGKVLLKLTSGKTLALTDVLHVRSSTVKQSRG